MSKALCHHQFLASTLSLQSYAWTWNHTTYIIYILSRQTNRFHIEHRQSSYIWYTFPHLPLVPLFFELRKIVAGFVIEPLIVHIHIELCPPLILFLLHRKDFLFDPPKNDISCVDIQALQDLHRLFVLPSVEADLCQSLWLLLRVIEKCEFSEVGESVAATIPMMIICPAEVALVVYLSEFVAESQLILHQFEVFTEVCESLQLLFYLFFVQEVERWILWGLDGVSRSFVDKELIQGHKRIRSLHIRGDTLQVWMLYDFW